MAFNSDVPSLPVEYIQLAVQLFDAHDVVFGPSEDGGYYLVRVEKTLSAGCSVISSGALLR